MLTRCIFPDMASSEAVPFTSFSENPMPKKLSSFHDVNVVYSFCMAAERAGFTPELLKYLVGKEPILFRNTLSDLLKQVKASKKLVERKPLSEMTQEELAELLSEDIMDIGGFSLRTINLFLDAGIRTVRDLVVLTKEQLIRTAGIDKASISAVNAFLSNHQLGLSMQISDTDGEIKIS